MMCGPWARLPEPALSPGFPSACAWKLDWTPHLWPRVAGVPPACGPDPAPTIPGCTGGGRGSAGRVGRGLAVLGARSRPSGPAHPPALPTPLGALSSPPPLLLSSAWQPGARCGATITAWQSGHGGLGAGGWRARRGVRGQTWRGGVLGGGQRRSP